MNYSLRLTSLLAVLCFFRSKLGLFQSRISLQKASVKVRAHSQRHKHNTISPFKGRAFKQTLLNKNPPKKHDCFTLFQDLKRDSCTVLKA